jgi:hypothetical protein
LCRKNHIRHLACSAHYFETILHLHSNTDRTPDLVHVHVRLDVLPLSRERRPRFHSISLAIGSDHVRERLDEQPRRRRRRFTDHDHHELETQAVNAPSRALFSSRTLRTFRGLALMSAAENSCASNSSAGTMNVTTTIFIGSPSRRIVRTESECWHSIHTARRLLTK